MIRRMGNVALVAALVAAQLPATGFAQPVPVTQPETRPAPVRPNPGRPVIQPPRPNPGGPQIQPPRPGPGFGGPQIQPPRPDPSRPRPPRPPRPPIYPPVRPPIYPPVYPGSGGGYNSTVRCESFNYQYRRCGADTRGGVRLVRVRGGDCRQGRSWGYERNSIWVSRGCRADFGVRGYGGGGGGGGNNSGAIIAGVAVGAGLLAILAANANKNKAASEQPAPYNPPAGGSTDPAAIEADLGGVQPDARPAINICLAEAARQIGATGGTRLRWDRVTSLEPGNGGWRVRAVLIATYPDEARDVPIYCRATPTKVIELTFGT